MAFGARATFFSGKAKTRHPQCKVFASLPNRINHKYYKFVDVLVPSTRKMADPSYHKNLVNPNFTDVIPRFSRVQPATIITPRNRISNLFAAGRFVSKKGFNHLLEAVSRLSPDNPDIRLTIAGDGPELNRLLEMRSELGLDSIVVFIGFRYDVPDLIARSDLLIVPSKIEPFGNILLEGMAAGTPIVTSVFRQLHYSIASGICNGKRIGDSIPRSDDSHRLGPRNSQKYFGKLGLTRFFVEQLSRLFRI